MATQIDSKFLMELKGFIGAVTGARVDTFALGNNEIVAGDNLTSAFNALLDERVKIAVAKELNQKRSQ